MDAVWEVVRPPRLVSYACLYTTIVTMSTVVRRQVVSTETARNDATDRQVLYNLIRPICVTWATPKNEM